MEITASTIFHLNGIAYKLTPCESHTSTNEKDWEVQSYIVSFWGITDEVFIKNLDGTFVTTKNTLCKERLKESHLIQNNARIHSVLRKGDGVVFSVGDEVEDKIREGKKTITSFTIRDNGLVVNFDSHGRYLNDIWKPLPKRTTNEKDWQIECIVKSNKNYWRQKNGLYNSQLFVEHVTWEWLLEHGGYIFQVARKSDGVVFTVGDKIKSSTNLTDPFVVKKIHIINATGLAEHGSIYLDSCPLERAINLSQKTTNEKDWEVLFFENIAPLNGIDVAGFTLGNDDLYHAAIGFPKTLNALLGNKSFSIKTVRRKSDGVVFSVGDWISHQFAHDTKKITSFFITDKNEMACYCSNDFSRSNYFIENWIKLPSQRTKLYITEEGTPVYDMDTFPIWKVDKYYQKMLFSACDAAPLKNPHCKYFAIEKNAQEYITLNKPCLSVNDVIDYPYQHYLDKHTVKKSLIKLAESKLYT